jgi:predicted SnoaL-like aldol condensation-catalyzing enzyme
MSSSLTETNRLLMADFAEIFYHERDVRRAFEKYVSAEEYVQHNPSIADGRETAVAALHDKFAHPNARFEIKKILVDEDLAVVHVRAFPSGGNEAAVADFYRIRAGKIIEHWDVLQLVPETAQNNNSMF